MIEGKCDEPRPDVCWHVRHCPGLPGYTCTATVCRSAGCAYRGHRHVRHRRGIADNDEQQRQASAATLSIARATWDDARKRLNVAGTSTPQATVSLVNAYDPSQLLGSDTAATAAAGSLPVQSGSCRVRATQADGQIAGGNGAQRARRLRAQGEYPAGVIANSTHSGTTGVAVTS